MKKALRIISLSSGLLFIFLWAISKFNFLAEYNSASLRSVLVIISLLLHLIYSQMEIKKLKSNNTKVDI
ncbi:hypothetical protein ACQY1Q_08875 [Tenacibaculum sp. TC6]|uniref:hypothetical protein n=1 Tax=Tenacibaculum sp. TC6 TaxID=3423223 RepID=UPI003D369E09